MASTIPPYLNGDTMSSSGTQQYTEFYEKLFSLQEDVYAGKHPRLRLPKSVLHQILPPHAVQNVQSPSIQQANGTGNSKIAVPGPKDVVAALFPPFAPTPPKSFPPPPLVPAANRPMSGIDPVLLTKSDDLVRAELQLKRQRIERQFKDQVDAKKGQPRDKDYALEAETGFDVTEVLNRAHEIVKPISGLPDVAPSDSFDEDSYYSSKASWSPEAGAVVDDSTELPVPTNARGNDRADPVEIPNDEVTIHAEDIDPDDEYEPTADLEMIEPEYHPELSGFHHSDDDYSPPPADLSAVRPQYSTAAQSGGHNSHTRYGHGDHSPEPEVPIIRSHIRSPIAPQPSRISPLATAKQPRGNRARNAQQTRSRQNSPRHDNNRPNDRQNQGGQGNNNWKSPRNNGNSPKGPKNGVQNPRKRRREAEQQEKQGKNSGKRVARSPIPQPAPEPVVIVKEEPVSPPPFGFFAEPPVQRRRLQQYGEEVEIVSPRERAYPSYHRDPEPRLVQRIYEVDEPTSPGLVRIPSRSTHRRMDRDDQDLRRVASLQYARRPQSPLLDPRPSRAASHAFIDHPPQPIYRSASMLPPAPRYIRECSRSPIYIDDAGYAPRLQSPVGMRPPPPPRAYVLDEYGNKYYAAPPPPPQEHMLEQRASTREPLLRSTAVRAMEPYEEDDALRMPPPSRRYVEHAQQLQGESLEARPYRLREYSLSHGDEYGERRMAGSSSAGGGGGMPQQQYVSRSYSMRPEVLSRDGGASSGASGGVEYVSRHQSIAPPQPLQQRRAESVVQYGYRVPSSQGQQGLGQQRRYVDDVEHQQQMQGQSQQQQRRYVEDVELDMVPMEQGRGMDLRDYRRFRG